MVSICKCSMLHTHTHTHVNGYCIVYNTSSSGVAVMIAHAGRQADAHCVYMCTGGLRLEGALCCVDIVIMYA